MSPPKALATTGPISRRRMLKLGGPAIAAGAAQRAGVVHAEAELGAAARRVPRITDVGRTGHNLGGAFLAWWLQHGGPRVLSRPVTEVERVDGTEVQFFQRGALARVRPGDDTLANEPLDLGGTWAELLDRPALPGTESDPASVYWFQRTGRGVHPACWRTFRDEGGAHAFGSPISNAAVWDGRLTQ